LFAVVLLLSCVSASIPLFLPSQQAIDQPQTKTAPNNTTQITFENQTTAFNPPSINDLEPTPTSIPNEDSTHVGYSTITQLAIDVQSEPNENVLLSAIQSLESNGGGQIILEDSLTLTSQDVLIPNNTVLSGADPQITIFLSGKNLQIPPNAQNITIKDLTIDASGLDQRFSLIIGEKSSNILLDNLKFVNHPSINRACLLDAGNNVTINKTSFTNVTQASPIQLNGSNASVTNTDSNDASNYPLIDVIGGLTNINIINNSAINRPLIWANYCDTPAKNILIENNTNHFPANTYGILVKGGVGTDTPVSDENVTIKGNYMQALGLAWNAIAVYGLTRDAIIEGNKVDMSQSGHNGIAVSSGINVKVTKNVVYGCTEVDEGGIEVESNPAHNRAVGFSENVTVVDNTVYDSFWGIYVRVMIPNHPSWNGTVLLSKNITIENNLVYRTHIGVNLLYGENLTVRNNNIINNEIPFQVDPNNVFNYNITNNIGYP
jgi:hypothetical protein